MATVGKFNFELFKKMTISQQLNYLDRFDSDKGEADHKIQKCIWEQYQACVGCKGIDNFITTEKAKETLENEKYMVCRSVTTPEEELKSQDELEKSTTFIGSFDVKGNDEPMEELKAKENVFEVETKLPDYPGGPQQLFADLTKSVNYPKICEEKGIQGRVIVTFYIEKDGSAGEINVVKSVDPHLDKEAIRVIKNMPRWIPGTENGSATRVKYTVPITFRLQ